MHIKETYLKKYGAWEYSLFIIGWFVIIKLGINFWNDEFSYSLNEIGASLLAIILIAKPLTIIDIVRKLRGLEKRNDKFNVKTNENNNDK